MESLFGIPPYPNSRTGAMQHILILFNKSYLVCFNLWFPLWFMLLVVCCMAQLTFGVARDFTPCINTNFAISKTQLWHDICYSWCADDSVHRQLTATGSVVVPLYPMKVNRLIDLPCDYTELINQVSTFTSVSNCTLTFVHILIIVIYNQLLNCISLLPLEC